MSLDYTSYVAQISALTVIGSTDPNFTTILPAAIAYCEDRIYRELDLLATRVTDSTTSFSSGAREFTLPIPTAGPFLVVEQLSAFTPATYTSSVATRQPLSYVSRDWLDATYGGNQTTNGLPQFFTMADNATVIVAPVPAAAYVAEVVGTVQPTPLSSSNTTTIITTMLPDLMIAGSMIFMSGYMRDFGAQGSDPNMAQSWESQFKTLMASANVYELRKRYMSQAWTSYQPTPLATPPRA